MNFEGTVHCFFYVFLQFVCPPTLDPPTLLLKMQQSGEKDSFCLPPDRQRKRQRQRQRRRQRQRERDRERERDTERDRRTDRQTTTQTDCRSGPVIPNMTVSPQTMIIYVYVCGCMYACMSSGNKHCSTGYAFIIFRNGCL